MARILIGTSGWHYDSWRGPFFPKGLPLKNQLQYYASQFPTAELNGGIRAGIRRRSSGCCPIETFRSASPIVMTLRRLGSAPPILSISEATAPAGATRDIIDLTRWPTGAGESDPGRSRVVTSMLISITTRKAQHQPMLSSCAGCSIDKERPAFRHVPSRNKPVRAGSD